MFHPIIFTFATNFENGYTYNACPGNGACIRPDAGYQQEKGVWFR